VYSSRKLEAKTYEDVAFRYLSADAHPDHDTLAEFRKRHLEALAGLFTQALLLCAKAGLVKLGHVSIDGTKIKANASKHKAMSYARMGETEQRLKQEIEALLQQAEDVDAAEDAQYRTGQGGVGARGTGKGRTGACRRGSQTGRAARRGRADRQEEAGPRTHGSRSGEGATGSKSTAQLHRS
jgi:hypothetical protein